jgi:drug/metabolite transporter (DMT)-like permease
MSQKSEFVFFLIMIMAMTFWGGSWISGKLVSTIVHQDLLLVWRFLFCILGFLSLYPFLRFSLRVPRTTLPLLFAAGAMMVLYNLFFFLGVRYGFAGKGGVMVTTLNPAFTFFIGAVVFRSPVRKVQFLGLLLGLLGGFLLIEPWKYSPAELIRSGNLFFLAAAVSWSILTQLAGRIMKRGVGLFTYNLYLYLVAWGISLLLALDNNPLDFSQYSSAFWINIIYLSLFSACIGATLYFLATRRLGAGRASSFTLLVPAIAVFLSWIILGEVPQFFTITGGAIAVSAVYLINLGKRKGEAL